MSESKYTSLVSYSQGSLSVAVVVICAPLPTQATVLFRMNCKLTAPEAAKLVAEDLAPTCVLKPSKKGSVPPTMLPYTVKGSFHSSGKPEV